MGTLDKKSAAIPLNTFKQDYNFIAVQGGRGGGLLPSTGCSRYTFWIDYDPFDVNNRRLITQNVSFQVFSDSHGTTPIVPYIIVGQSNDIPDEQVVVGNTSQGESIIIPSPTQPPYYLDTKFTSQPVNTNYQNDQGRYTYAGYAGYGYGFGQTQMVGQAFVPEQPKLTGFFLRELFHTNTTDHTTFFALNLELWDANHNFYAHLGTLQPTYNSAVQPTGLTTDSACTAYCNNLTYNTADDGHNYWISLNSLGVQLTNPISVTPGATYYIMVRLSTLTAANYYFLGHNANNTVYSGLGRYTAYNQHGVAVSAHAVVANDGSSTFSNLVDANSFPLDFPFITQGNVGRTAITFWWANQANPTSMYWQGEPTGSLSGQFKFIHLDYDQRI